MLGKRELVASMASSRKVVYLALVGYPILEVASIVTSRGQTVDIFHHFVNYFNDTWLESCLAEQEPITDSFGTRFEHAISEAELGQNGLSLKHVQAKFRRFLSSHDISCLVVNNLEQYQYLTLPVDANHVWYECNNPIAATVEKEMKVRILQEKRCLGHRSIYYEWDGKKEPTCALQSAAKMVYELNYV